jgi:hypothetical protein
MTTAHSANGTAASMRTAPPQAHTLISKLPPRQNMTHCPCTCTEFACCCSSGMKRYVKVRLPHEI